MDSLDLNVEQLAEFITRQYSGQTFLNLEEFLKNYHSNHDSGHTNPYLHAELQDHVCQALEYLHRTQKLTLNFIQYTAITERAEIDLIFD